MTTITKEQAQKIIDAADDVISALAGTNDDIHPEIDALLRTWDDTVQIQDVRELARIALASLEAKPVAYLNRFTGRSFELEQQPGADKDPGVYIPLYAAPPAPVSEPAISDNSVHDLFLRAKALMYQSGGSPIEHSLNPVDAWLFEAERAANKQAEPVSQTYKLHDGWIAVSDRVPDSDTDVLCACEFDGPGDWRKKVGYLPSGKWIVYGASWEPTHWMPLPAAPQQEASND
ncbi:DUF551 domain-containing protein [Edwardsiella tarda]